MLIDKAALVSAAQRSDSVIRIYIFIVTLSMVERENGLFSNVV